MKKEDPPVNTRKLASDKKTNGTTIKDEKLIF